MGIGFVELNFWGETNMEYKTNMHLLNGLKFL